MPYFRTWAPFFGLSVFLCVCISEAALPQSLQTSTQDGLKLLHKMQTALGGAERIAAIHDYEETVRAEVPATPTCFTSTAPQGQGGRIVPDLKGPDKFKTTGKAIELVGGEVEFAKNYLSGFEFKTWLADRIPGYTVSSFASNVLRIKRDGAAEDLTLDPATWLPIRLQGFASRRDEPIITMV